MLIEAALVAARDLDARGLMVETQTTNFGAMRFYERAGFAWCGLDTSLYDPLDVARGEVAIFLWREIP
jgi:ribosomal protein S18 acetylase RimI-like enzyme